MRRPSYLLGRVPPEIRQAISDESARREIAVADVLRGILCARYRMHCPPTSAYVEGKDKGAPDVLLRLPPKLHRALRIEAASAGRPMRSIILETLEAHYEKGAA